MSVPAQQLPAYQNYLAHQKGLVALWLWMDAWAGLEGWAWEKSILTLSPLASQRFALGAPKKKTGVRGRQIFLGFQKEEGLWLKFISWHHCVWDASQSRLWLVSRPHTSPDELWPDIPSVAVGIFVDPEKLGLWNGKILEGRSLWWDEDQLLHVSVYPELSWSGRVGSLANNWAEHSQAPVASLRDLVLQKIASSNVFMDPGYQGAPPQLSSEQQGLVQPFRGDNSARPADFIERANSNIFGAFLDPDKKK